MIIRREEPQDIAAIRFVNEQAFGGSVEVNAIDLLRDRGAATLSLLAVIDERVVGHLFFSPVTIESRDRSWPGLGLAPLSVLPEFQRRGIGTALMNAGLEECRRLGHVRVIDDVEALTEEPANFRLCKGIYLEPRTIAWTDPELLRRNFTLALERMFERGAYVGIATHDEQLVWEALRLVRRFGLKREQYEFQMLLGVDEELRRILIGSGHRLRVYVPYGERWYAYSVRRLRENPQIARHALRAILKGV